MITPTPSIPGSLGSACPLGITSSTPALSISHVIHDPPAPPGTLTKLYRYLFSSADPASAVPIPLEVRLLLFPCGAVVNFQPTTSTYPVHVTVVSIDSDDPDQLLYTVRRSDGVLIVPTVLPSPAAGALSYSNVASGEPLLMRAKLKQVLDGGDPTQVSFRL